VKSPSCSWRFVLVFPLQPTATAVQLLDIHSKKPMKFLFVLEQIRIQVAKYTNSSPLMLIGCTHIYRLLRRHIFLHITACKTSMFPIALEFFTFALFKEY